MSEAPDRPRGPAGWLWLSWLPVFGGAVIVLAGKRTNNLAWITLGLAFLFFSLILYPRGLGVPLWFAQVGMGVYVRQRVLSHPALSGGQERRLPLPVRAKGEKVDINTCSKNDLVYKLGLPIAYANDIDAVRREGYLFTHVEELSEIAGLPENYQEILAPAVTFSYDLRKESAVSWRRLNHQSAEELIAAGIEALAAGKIVGERERNGPYRSAIEVRERTGIPLSAFQDLL